MAYEVLDVSKWNPIEDYTQAAASVDGVIMRCGVRGYGSSGTISKDTLFDTHYNGFKNTGTKIGVYFFTQATTEAEGIEEANYVYNIIKDLNIDFPVYIDSEYGNSDHTGRADSLSADVRTNCVFAFCERMKELGYRTGIYASDSWYKSQLDYTRVKAKTDYSIWVANYSATPSRVESYDGWQYTSSGTISGYSNRVDLSHFYVDVAGWENKEPVDIATLSCSLEKSSYTYNGSANIPNIIIKNGDTSLVKDTDFTAVYSSNINAGTGKVSITGINNYTGTTELQFTINKFDITDSINITCGEPDEWGCYNQSNLTFNKSFNMSFVESTDYTKLSSTNESGNISYINLTITGTGNYTGSVSEQFIIDKPDISECNITLLQDEYNFDGIEKCPDVEVKDGDLSLNKDTDYTVSYNDNLNAGQASVTVTGNNNYKGSSQLQFNINARDIMDIDITCGEPDSHNCYDLDNLTLKLGEYTLIKNVDYSKEITTKQNDRYIVSTVNITGMNNFDGSINVKYNTEKILIDISSFTISISPESFIYNSQEHTPTVVVEDDESEPLAPELDFTVSYTDNINVGTATAIATGIDDYKGTLSKTFNIQKCNISEVDITCGEPDSNGCYNLNNLTLKLGNYILVEGEDYNKTVTTERNINHYYISTVDITCIGNFEGHETKQYNTSRIIVKDIGTIDYSLDNSEYVYDGFSKEPTITLHDGDYTLIVDTDYTFDYSDNINAGIGYVIITGINNYSGTSRAEFQINEANIGTAILSCGAKNSDGFYDLKNISVSFNSKILKKNEDYVYTTQERIDYEEKIIYTNVTVYGQDNYTGSISKEFPTSKYIIDINTLDISLSTDKFIYSGEVLKPTVVTPEELVINEDYTVICDDNINVGTYIVTIKGINDYNGQMKLNYTIEKRDFSDEIEATCGEPDEEGCCDISQLQISIDDKILEYGVEYTTQMTEEEAQSGYTNTIVKVLGIRNYKGENTFTFHTNRKELYPGKKLNLVNVPLYPRYSQSEISDYKTGVFYLWDDIVVNGRIRITRELETVKEAGFITGWILKDDFIQYTGINIGDLVLVHGNIYKEPIGSSNFITKNTEVMYVSEKLDSDKYDHCYGLSSSKNRAIQGWADSSIITKYVP